MRNLEHDGKQAWIPLQSFELGSYHTWNKLENGITIGNKIQRWIISWKWMMTMDNKSKSQIYSRRISFKKLYFVKID